VEQSSLWNNQACGTIKPVEQSSLWNNQAVEQSSLWERLSSRERRGKKAAPTESHRDQITLTSDNTSRDSHGSPVPILRVPDYAGNRE